MHQMSYELVVADIGAQVIEMALSGLQSAASVSTAVAALVPAGADEVSAQAAAAFTAEGMQMAAVNTLAQDELKRTGQAFVDIARIYTEVDDDAAGTMA
ncbi:hypothetical protein I546_5343 [Mycobacterium kansasii 732]|uniref:PE family immunomodulator PE35 n=2 Tax=Mycobacterium pseudokansasii TaxID=2341080 RepID=A0A498QYQ3_9MYCO|nr:hypothetical protein I546_5343 [Mycobacterium kansasii 732]KZS60554.1 cell motility protein [Mycobacterium kansasii]VBA30532.1 PE family immunomodulator PE35 [Mycobacterium pseudokansasii]VBA32349.1 PE family immunomodulator PE35 [Mycobacterium pseudokansasii]VBA54455.1 PE family immunomodulator PE35 [Mycobacterium pseudokansasii]